MDNMKKLVLKLNIHDNKDKQKAMKAVSSLAGVNSIAVDMKESKMTVIGDVDPVDVVCKLKKQWSPQLLTVGPAKEEKKDGKKEDKKDEKKDEKKDGKKDEKDQMAELLKQQYMQWQLCHYAYPPAHPACYCVQEENPSFCTIL